MTTSLREPGIANVEPETLSDNSVAYNVVMVLDDESCAVKFACTDERAAHLLCIALNETAHSESIGL